MKNNGRFLLAGGAIVAVALALRLHHLGAEELWLDEAFTFRDVTVPSWLAALKDVPPLYPLLLHAWMAVAGPSEPALRLPSALLGTLTVVAIMWAGVEIFDRRIALWSGLWAAVSPIAVYYSQEARPYALVTALTATAYAVVWRALRRDRRTDWVLATAVVAALLYSHFLAMLAVLPTAAMLLAWPRGERVRHYAATLGVATVALLPWITWSLVTTPRAVTWIDWIAAAWERTRFAVPTSLELLTLGSERGRLPITMKQFDVLDFAPALRVLALATLALLAFWLVVPSSDAEGRSLGRRKAMLGAFILGPLVALWTVSWWKPMYLAGRYDQLALPGFALALGVAFETLARASRVAVAVAVLALLAPVGTKLALYYGRPLEGREPNRQIAERLAATVRSGDLVVFTGLRRYQVVYQLALRGWRCTQDRCDEPSGRYFASRTFPRRLGPLPTQADAERVANAPDVVRADIEEDLGATGSPARVVVALWAYAIQRGSFAVSPEDAAFLEQLVAVGFAPAVVDPRLGVVEYRRGAAAGGPVPAVSAP